MKKILVACAVLAAGVVVAEPSGDRPDDRHAWAVHDVNRPDPVKIDVPESGVPSDAIRLFDGTAESVKANWRSRAGEASKWTVKDGAFVCAPGSGPAVTAESFADCQLHIEWKTPVDDVEGWGNSGVIFMGQYEIQILDSSAITPSKSPWKPANYADGQAGAVYGQNPPLVNPCRRPGEWQSYDIVFHPPRREGARLVDPGSVTVFFNGVLVQDDWPFQGTTGWCRRIKTHATATAAPLYLQDHGHPVPFRNIWIRRIPSRFADTVNGSVGTKYGDVARLRHELAAQSLAFAQATDDPAERFIRLWESFCYEPDRAVKRRIEAVEEATVKALAAGAGSFGDPRRFNAFRRFVKMLVDSGWMPGDAKVPAQLGRMPAPPKPQAPNMRDY
ncbi:MAG: DUF1080 domain-containing protein [Kiritimatiellia bacterium]